MLSTGSIKRVLLSGASRGIGFAIAKELLNAGYFLVMTARNIDSFFEIEKAFDVYKNSFDIRLLDLSSKDQIINFSQQLNVPLWGVVNNAAICKSFGIQQVGDDPFEEVLFTNLVSPYLLTRLIQPQITRPGRIINIASQLGLEGRAHYGAYCASKFALIGLTKCWAKELGSTGITVNAVCPGWVSTEMALQDVSEIALRQHGSFDDVYGQICEPLELKRFNTPDEVAFLVSFLLSEKSSGITGRDFLMQTIWNQS